METRTERIQKDIESINAFTATPGKGITRFTFSREYMEARSYVAAELNKIGARVTTTCGGSLRGRLAGSDTGSPAVLIGSHLDSVFQGGKFDGVAGVVSALEAARVISENKIHHRHPIDVVVFAEEEGSRFGSIMTGSRAWIGQLSRGDLQRLKDRDGIGYTEAMEKSGLIPDEPSFLKGEEIKAMIELHIEQSVVLERKGFRIGVVDGIAGIKQFIVTIHGVPNHAGGTPMDLRFDALQGAVRMMAAAEEMAMEMGQNTVATVGYVNCEPGQANVIPGMVQFTLDIRNPDSNLLQRAVDKILAVIEKVCRERSLSYEIKSRSDTPPVALSQEIVLLIEQSAEGMNVKTMRMTSGALHDSSIMAAIAPVGMIFVPSKDGRSHCPEEFTAWEDIKLGTDILLSAVVELCS